MNNKSDITITSNIALFKTIGCCLLTLVIATSLLAQKQLPLLQATKVEATIEDGENVKIKWKLDPNIKPDIYYVNIPRRNGKVKFSTDKGHLSFKTRYGNSYDLVVLLNGKDSCFVRIVAKEQPGLVSLQLNDLLPQSIPFTLIGSRIYFQGQLNGQKKVTIQFDLGAGTSCVSKLASEKLQLSFDRTALVNNTQGLQETRVSSGNKLVMGDFIWSGVPLTEVGNMDPYEDLIIGNGLFRDKIIEIDYDKNLFTVHDQLPAYAKNYKKQSVFYEQDRPKFKAGFIQDGRKYSYWFLFDTGREGTMLIGEDFTGQDNNWEKLKELQFINGRKIVRLDASIAGREFKDIVTNAADPSKPAGRPTLFGNQVLNHFNVILDNHNGYIYLKTNSRSNEPYADYQKYLKDVQEYNKSLNQKQKS